MEAVGAHPDTATVGHDLDPTNGSGDLTVTVPVDRQQAVVIAGNSTDNRNWSASITWENANGDAFVSESKTDIELDTVSNDWARVVRKAPFAKVTFTSEETGGTQNNLNAYLDTHR